MQRDGAKGDIFLMKDYVIVTDSASDISSEKLGEWGVSYLELTFRFSGEDKEYANYELPATEFYGRMRAGAVAKTAAVNVQSFTECFEKFLSEGKDVLCISFSSGLSTTANSARLAAEQLAEKYPDNKVIAIDSLAASAGLGLLIYLAVQKKNAGATIEEVASYITETIPHLCHWFTVDDLVYLKRGGRISPAAAFFGNAIGIKPVLHVDNEGHLVKFDKVRGRKSSIQALASKYGERALDLQGGTVYISHGDCIKDAEELANILHEKYGATVDIITDVGPVIGAHSGPGTLALFYIGSER